MPLRIFKLNISELLPAVIAQTKQASCSSTYHGGAKQQKNRRHSVRAACSSPFAVRRHRASMFGYQFLGPNNLEPHGHKGPASSITLSVINELIANSEKALHSTDRFGDYAARLSGLKLVL
jgi:hypothetical protein